MRPPESAAAGGKDPRGVVGRVARMRTRWWRAAARRVARTPWLMRMLPGRWGASILAFTIKADRLSLASDLSLLSLYELCIDPALPPGALVECGVAKGGSIALMSFATRGERPIWGFDSFQGMPPLTAEDQGDGQSWVGVQCSGPDGPEEVKRTLSRFELDGDWIRLVPGWFEESLPQWRDRLSSIAVLRLDNDWYRSTRYCLETLYDLVPSNGVVIIDDYHAFQGCRRAVDEFRARRGITAPLVTIDQRSEAYWRKTD